MRIGAYAGVSVVVAVATVLHAWQTRYGQYEAFACNRFTLRVLKLANINSGAKVKGVREAIMAAWHLYRYTCQL